MAWKTSNELMRKNTQDKPRSKKKRVLRRPIRIKGLGKMCLDDDFEEPEDLRALVNKQKRRAARYKSKCQELQGEIEGLENERDEKDEEIEGLETERYEKDEEIEERDEKIQEMTDEMSTVTSQHEKEISSLRRELSDFKKGSEAISANQECVIAGLHKSLAEERRRLTSKSSRLKVSCQDYQKLQSKATQEEQRSQGLHSQVGRLTDEIASTRNALELSHSNLASKEYVIEKVEAELANANGLLGMARAEVDILKTTTTIFDLKLDTANEALANEQLGTESLRDQVGILEDRLGDAHDALARNQLDADQKRQELEEKVNTIQGEFAKTQLENDALRIQANTLTKDLSASQSTLLQTQHEASYLRSQVSTLTSELADANRISASTQLTIAEERSKNRETALAAAAREKRVSEEQRRLIMRINTLELGASRKLTVWLMGGFRGIMMGVVHYVGTSRWSRYWPRLCVFPGQVE